MLKNWNAILMLCSGKSNFPHSLQPCKPIKKTQTHGNHVNILVNEIITRQLLNICILQIYSLETSESWDLDDSLDEFNMEISIDPSSHLGYLHFKIVMCQDPSYISIIDTWWFVWTQVMHYASIQFRNLKVTRFRWCIGCIEYEN